MDEKFSLFYEALLATELDQLLVGEDRDETYVPISDEVEVGDWFTFEYPASRRFGFALLMESNETFANHGIETLDDLKHYAAAVYDEMYPEDKNIADITNRKNSLNRFVAYHILNKNVGYNLFINAFDTGHMYKEYELFEYHETMCPNTLFEAKLPAINRQNFYINDLGENNRVQINRDYSDRDASNGVYHEIDNILVYSKEFHAYLTTKRLRFNSVASFPELINNNIRGKASQPYENKNQRFYLPTGYVDRITNSEQTTIAYLTPFDRYQNYHGDEFYLKASSGKLYDFSVVTLPIPEGTYEVRFGYRSNNGRGVAQLYFDGYPAGVPLDLNILGNDPSIGYIKPGNDPEDPYGYENDKMMRNRGYMKAPACFRASESGWSDNPVAPARENLYALRKILGTYTFKEAGTHTLSVKGLSNGEFMFNYIEFVPTEILEFEDIY